MRSTLDFLLYDWLAIEALTQRDRYADHSRETFDAVLDNCERIAREKFAPFNRLADTEEPGFDGERVSLPQATHEAALAYAASGMLAASQDYAVDGMQLPCTVTMSGNAFFFRASVGLAAYGMLTSGNANLIMAHGTDAQRRVFAANELAGRWFGTMCLSEPQAGSSLSDLATRAVPDGDDFASEPLGPRYRLSGNKMWISGGEHDIVDNILHLVLAKIPDASGALPVGAKGISLFIVPKWLVDADGRRTGERNDVALAGLNHKLGYRGATNTLLNFGEGRCPVRGGPGAIGYRIGPAGAGLKCMFHMMNEARISVGLGAAMLGYAGYEASLDYARGRPQGRAIGAGGKDATQPQVRIIEHADVKRMLLAQKAFAEGALALGLYCARLVDEQQTGQGAAPAEAALLLEVLTPIAKSWPSEWCLEANSLAIQVLGGYGYTRDYPVEQFWRDNRLNMIHEGTHGIQALDLLGRKVVMDGGAGLALLVSRVGATVRNAAIIPEFAESASALAKTLERVGAATQQAWATGVPEEALANATPYLQAFGHTVLAWLWLDIALAARQALATAAGDRADLLRGKVAAMRYFFGFELPKVEAWLAVVASRNPTCRDMQDSWF
jgi:butyryl-CoA dehydrogenase